MGAAVARRAHKASWVGLAGLQYLCLTCSESYDRATDRFASAEWFLTQLAKVGLPFPLSLSKPTDNKWKLDYIYYKQHVVNHLFGVGEGISVAEALDYCPRHLFQAELLRQPFPVAVPCLFLLAGQNGISRDRTTEGQKDWFRETGIYFRSP